MDAGYPAPNIDESLSSPNVSAFAEDGEGRIWIGTARGLNCYDGYSYYQYYTEHGLPDNEVYDILEDMQHRLWVATAAGVCFRSAETGRFHAPKSSRTRLVRDPKLSPEGDIYFNNSMEILRYLPGKDSLAVVLRYSPTQLDTPLEYFFPAEGRMVLLSGNELLEYDTKNFSLLHRTALPGPTGTSFLDGTGVLWISTSEGLVTYVTTQGHLGQAPAIPPEYTGSMTPSHLLQILPYTEGRWLLNTSDRGVLLYDSRDGSVIDSESKQAPQAINGRKFRLLFVDSRNDLWLSSWYEGITLVRRVGRPFAAIPNLTRALDGEHIVSVGTDSQGNLWLCGTSGTLFRYVVSSRELQTIPILDFCPGYDGSVISQMYVDSRDGIWITGNASIGTVQCKYTGGQVHRVRSWPVINGLSFAEDGEDIWMGNWSHCLFRFNNSNGHMEEFPVFPKGYTHVSTILRTDEGLIVGAFSHPIKILDTRSLVVRDLITEDIWKPVIRRGDYIPTVFYKDRQNNLWIGSDANGLIRYNLSDGSITPVPGAPCENIASIEEDNQGDLWVSTQHGLGLWDRQTGLFTNFRIQDGLNGNTFFDRSSITLPDGTMVFGGTHGVTVFNPEDTRDPYAFPLIFTSLKVGNQWVEPLKGGVIEAPLTERPAIHLGYRQRNLSIGYAALTYSGDEQPRYYYIMEGLDREWTEAGKHREASYPSIPSGKYTFRVRIASPGGTVAPVEISMPVTVDKEPWNTPWAWLAYFLSIIGILGAFLQYRSRALATELAAREAEAEKEHERNANRLNASYFANIAHEFRTPLTLISGPLSIVRRSEGLTSKEKGLLSTVDRNVGRMLHLVNQLLDFNKLDNDALQLQVVQTDIIPVIQYCTELFLINADERNIALKFVSHETSFITVLDEDKIIKVLSNLLSNALKHTPEGGEVTVFFDVVDRNLAAQSFPLTDRDSDAVWARVSVQDSGPGIPLGERENIFRRYYQLDDSGTNGRLNYGTGIGLYFCRALVSLHHGYIKADARLSGPGSIFSFVLPVHLESYAEAELSSEPRTLPQVVSQVKDSSSSIISAEDRGEAPRGKVAVVDDDSEIVRFLKSILSDRYLVSGYYDAASALQGIRAEVPDLIISDIAMPGMDGLQLCSAIKDSLELSHIPVILLTAKSTLEEQVQGLDIGADAYVTKPFDPDYLTAMVGSLLRNREAIRHTLRESTTMEKLEPDTLSPRDKAFLKKFYAIMEENLTNPEPDIVAICSSLAMSRSKFYYKIKGLTGESPMEYFRSYKLNRAAEMLKTGEYNISEIADMTGFSTPSYFSTLFKKRFGVSPSEYRP